MLKKNILIRLINYFYNRFNNLYNYYFGFYEIYKIPFVFPKPLPESADEVLNKGCNILNDLNIKHCISFGTLLGIYRDKNLIPHDSDLDIDVVHPVNTKKIEKEFIKNGFKLGSKVIACGVVQKLAFYTKDEVVFDIAFYQKIDDFVYGFQEINLYFKFPFEFYKNFKKHPFIDYTLHIPNDPVGWLEYTYGKSWNIPKKSKRDFHEDQFFDEEGYGMHVNFEGNIINEIKRLKKIIRLTKD